MAGKRDGKGINSSAKLSCNWAEITLSRLRSADHDGTTSKSLLRLHHPRKPLDPIISLYPKATKTLPRDVLEKKRLLRVAAPAIRSTRNGGWHKVWLTFCFWALPYFVQSSPPAWAFFRWISPETAKVNTTPALRYQKGKYFSLLSNISSFLNSLLE